MARRAGQLHRAQERGAAARVRRHAAGPRRPATDRAALPALAGRDPRGRQGRGRRRPPQPDRRRRTTARSGLGRSTGSWRRSTAAWCCARSATGGAAPGRARSTSAASCFPTTAAAFAGRTAEPLPGVYAVGWIKRGPTGILGTNKRDAEETVAASPRIWPRRRCGGRPNRSRADRCAARRAQARPRHRRGLARDRGHELRARPRSQQRPRVKLASRDELLAAARP